MQLHFDASQVPTAATGRSINAVSNRNLVNSERGFTIIELLVSLLLTSLMFSSMLVVFQAQNRINTVEADISETQQNARVAMAALNQDIRQAGYFVDQFNRQPIWLDAAPYQLIFNANISDQFVAMHRDSAVPLSDGTMYNQGDYTDPPHEENLPGFLDRYLNESETIRLTLDTNYDGLITSADLQEGATNPNIFVLVKEINGNPPAILAYNVRGPRPYADGTMPAPMFKYWGTFVTDNVLNMWGDSNADGELSTTEVAALTPVTVAQLPNIRQVDVDMLIEGGRPDNRYVGTGSTESRPNQYRSYRLRGRIRARNVGINPSGLVLCGNAPAAPVNPIVIDTPSDQGGSITIRWNSSLDEYSNEMDVQYYTIYRRLGMGEFEVIGQIQGMGVNTTYEFEDDGDIDNFNSPSNGLEYYYYVAAWDCAPQESIPSTLAGPVISVANGPPPPTIEDAWDTQCDSGRDITVKFTKSAQDDGTSEGVHSYKIYRGTVYDSTIVSKILVHLMSADASPIYQWNDDEDNTSGLPPDNDVSYYYIIRAVRDTVESVNSNEFGAVWSTEGLSAPLSLAGIDRPGDNGEALILTWRKSYSEDCTDPGSNQYKIYRRVKGTVAWSHISNVLGTNLEFYELEDDNNGSGLTAGTTYEYIVAVTNGSETEESNIVEGTPLANPPMAPPTNLVAVDLPCDSDGDIQLTWYASPDDGAGTFAVDEYWIYRKIGGGVYNLMFSVTATGAATYDVTDSEVLNAGYAPVLGNTYWYKVTAYDIEETSQSDPTNEDDAISDGTPGAPAITAAYDVVGSGSREIRVEFDASADDGGCSDSVFWYHIYRSTTPGVYGTYVGQLSASDLSSYTYMDNSVNSAPPPGSDGTWYYMIKAYDAYNMIESLPSNEFGPVEPYGAGCICCPIFSDDFESGNTGWTSGGTRDDWELGDPNGKSFDPSLAYSGSFVWGNDMGQGWRDGQYRSRADNYLISPAMDFSGYEAGYVTLSFYRWLSVQRGNRDQARIRINTGSGWQTIWQNLSNENTVDSRWMLQLLDLSQWVLGYSSVQIAFTLESNSSQQFGGWNIDDVQVCYTAPTPCDYFFYVGDSVAQNQGNNLFFEITNGAEQAVTLLGMEIGWSATGSLLKSIRTQAGGPGLVWTVATAQPPIITAMFDTSVPFNQNETIRFKLTFQPGQMRGSAMTLKFITSCGTSAEIVIQIPM